MKVGFVTPFNVRSAIGQHARIVGEQLAKKGWTIDILRSEVTKEDFDPPLDTFLSVSWLVDAPASALNKEYDLLIYNIGDNYLFHGAALDRLPQCPGLLIAHDFFLHNLFSGWLTKDISPDRTHDRVISNLYGIDPTILKAKSGLLDLETIARLSPMVEWISQFSNGAIAHANFYADRLRMSCPGPVTVTPLAYQANHSVPPKKSENEDVSHHNTWKRKLQ